MTLRSVATRIGYEVSWVSLLSGLTVTGCKLGESDEQKTRPLPEVSQTEPPAAAQPPDKPATPAAAAPPPAAPAPQPANPPATAVASKPPASTATTAPAAAPAGTATTATTAPPAAPAPASATPASSGTASAPSLPKLPSQACLDACARALQSCMTSGDGGLPNFTGASSCTQVFEQCKKACS